jgi:hypothetical protein
VSLIEEVDMSQSLERRLEALEKNAGGSEPLRVVLLDGGPGVPWWEGEVVHEFDSLEEYDAWRDSGGEGDE